MESAMSVVEYVDYFVLCDIILSYIDRSYFRKYIVGKGTAQTEPLGT
jgi:hypothetical protein